TSAWSKVQAFDVTTGRLLWQYDPQVPGETGVKACCDVVNRGAAYWDGRIFVGTLDGRLIALDSHTGKALWSVLTVDQSKPYTITGAPRVIHGRVIIGNGGAELGVRGYVSAYDVADGKLAWRFYTVPGQPGHPDGAASDEIMARLASKSWTGQWWKDSGGGGGGTVWDSMAYDPALNLLYIGVGNASYWNAKYRSPGGGDNLFVSSIVALNADTGAYVWHYQEVPGDEWDYTATQHIILADLKIDGKMRKVLMQAPKNGFFYIIDRTNGKLVSAEPFSTINWASHIDRTTGRPVINPDALYSKTGKPWLGRPGPYGAHSWQPMAYSLQTGLVYIPVQDVPAAYVTDQGFKPMAKGYNLGIADTSRLGDVVPTLAQVRAATKGYLLAWNPVTQKAAWRVPHESFSNGGLLATAGGLLFQGTGEGSFEAYDAGSGARLWAFDAQDSILAAPVTYSVKGRQYVTVLVGWGGAGAMSGGAYVWGNHGVRKNKSRVLTFALGAKGHLPVLRAQGGPPPSAPPRPFGDAATIRVGEWAYGRTCIVCHSAGAVGGGGAPDLRHSPVLGDKDAWKSVVADGALAANGMVGFRDNFSPEQIEAIRAYVVARANITRGK
ncbi:MAG: PQQ-dependent dehydrogenase, methanol/ethanol family, partial [Pigmentiphaga sp.]